MDSEKDEPTISPNPQNKAPTGKKKLCANPSITNSPLEASLEWPPLHLGQAPVQLKGKFRLTGLEFPQVSLHLLSCLFLLQKHHTNKRTFHVSHLSSESRSAQSCLRERSQRAEKQPALSKGGESGQIRQNCLTKCIYEPHWTKCLPITAPITS